MNALEQIWTVSAKEIRDNLRDRRSVISALSSSLIGPGVLLLMIVIVGKAVFQEFQEPKFKLAVAGAEFAPGLIAFLEQQSVMVQPAPDNPQAAVRNGDLDVVLVVPEGYGEDFTAGRPASVRLVVDSSRQSAAAATERASSLVQAYSGQIGALRLIARGISPSVTQALAVERVDVATPQSQATIFLNMMPYFVVMVVFMGGMYVIIDATAGERERGSLEPLLTNPVPRWVLVWGKLVASLPFATFSLFTTLLAFAIVFNVFPLENFIGFQMSLDLAALAAIFFIALPMILLASSLQMIIATFTRSFKEAQTYVAFLPLIPALPGLGLAFLPVKAQVWMMLVPTFGQQLLINQLMRGEQVNLGYALLSAAATLVLAGIFIFLAIRLYERERLVFGAR